MSKNGISVMHPSVVIGSRSVLPSGFARVEFPEVEH